jgi:type I restriction enzyme S subunit
VSWPTAALGEVCNIQIGRTPSRANKSYWEGGSLPWVSIGDISRSDRILSTKEMITERAVTETGCKKIAAGTVLMSFKLSIGKLAIAQTPLFTNEAIAALEISKEDVLDPLFLFRAIENINFEDAGNRAAMGRTLNKQSLSEIKIPLPPLDKQRRIRPDFDA